MKQIQENIYNLNKLWILAGKNHYSFSEKEDFNISYIKNTKWPNRIWANKLLTKDSILRIEEELIKYPDLVFSYFNTANNYEIFKDTKLSLQSMQYGMSLPLKNMYPISKNLIFKKVENIEDATCWNELYIKGMGYQIVPNIILKIKDKVHFYIIFFENDMVGTIVIYQTNNTVGLHSLSILPKKRKQGFATEIMYHILNRSLEENFKLATLQASKMAKSIYTKIGFSTDFLMENYHLKIK